SSRHGYSSSPQPHSAELLNRIVATGRAFWIDHQRSPLRWGEPRAGRIEWRGSGKNGVAPQLIVSGAVALNAEPPVYVDEAAGSIGTVELDLHPRLAYQLLSAPVIPPAQVPEVSRRLALGRPDLHQALLPGPPASAVKIEEDPVPVLRFMVARSMSYGYFHQKTPGPMAVAHLSFRYGPIEIDRSERGTRIEAFQAGQTHLVCRLLLEK